MSELLGAVRLKDEVGMPRGLRDDLIWALIGGLSLDFLSGGPLGFFTLTILIVALVTSLFHGRLFGSNIVLPLGLTFP